MLKKQFKKFWKEEDEKKNEEDRKVIRQVAKGTMTFYLTRAAFIMIAGGFFLLFNLMLFGSAMVFLWAGHG